ncbi:MAG TPA: dihydrofolate reductase family protein [Acidimicrobiales bacterium]
MDRDASAALEHLKIATPGDVLVNGSIQLVPTLVAHNLADEYRLTVFPVVLGAGRRLFDTTAAPIGLQMTGGRPVGETAILTSMPRS